MTTSLCKICGKMNRVDVAQVKAGVAATCFICGNNLLVLQAPMKANCFCTNCGGELRGDFKFCGHCGHPNQMKKIGIGSDFTNMLVSDYSIDQWEKYFAKLTVSQFMSLGDVIFDFLADAAVNLTAENFNGTCTFLAAYAKYLMYYAHFQRDLPTDKREVAIQMAEFVMEKYCQVESFNNNKDRVKQGLGAFETWKKYCAEWGYSSPLYTIVELKRGENIFRD